MSINQKHESISLSGDDWLICRSPYESDIDCSEFDIVGRDWTVSQVPGNIQADLEKAHQLKPLWYGFGDPALMDVARNNWLYYKEFIITEEVKGKWVSLIFDGVDYECNIWLNGIKLGSHAGMFQRFDFEVSEVLNVHQINKLLVEIKRMPEQLVPYLIGSDGAESGYPTPYWFVHGMNKTRKVLEGLKSPTNFSYDWGTNIWTLGIWKDVYLEATGASRIEWVQVQSKLSDAYKKAITPISMEVDSLTDQQTKAVFSISGHGVNSSVSIDVELKEGKNKVTGELEVTNPVLWWPNGQGEQPLYEVEVRLEDRLTGDIIDVKRTRLGIREIRWEQVEGAPEDFINPYRLMVNGRPVRTMGSNLIPPDLLFGRIMERGPRLLQLAKEAGMNTLRLWGGGVILPEALYDLADDLGIMLSQEFPLANCLPEDDPEFIANLEETICNIVKQVRNHPSIMEWSGGNEMFWKQGDDYPALHVLEKVVREEDDRILRATCPMQGSRHSPWHYDPDTHYNHYDKDLTDNLSDSNDATTSTHLMRYGEFGCQTPANLETWHREIPPSSQWPIDHTDNVLLVRKNVVRAVFGTEFWLLKKYIVQLFGPLDNLDQLVEAGQFIGAEGLRYAIDAIRRKGRTIGGFTTWDYNEPWPNGAGSYMVDYDGRPLMNYDFVKQSLMPIDLSLKYDSILFDSSEGLRTDLFITSDASESVTDYGWEWIARDIKGNFISRNQGKAAVQPQEVLKLDELHIRVAGEASSSPLLIELYLYDMQGVKLSERIYLFGAKHLDAPFGELLHKDRNQLAYGTELSIESCEYVTAGQADILRISLKNNGSRTALFCEPHPILDYRTDISIDNNHSFIPPGESRVITIIAPVGAKCGLNLMQTGWRISCWNAEEVILSPSEDVLLSMVTWDAIDLVNVRT